MSFLYSPTPPSSKQNSIDEQTSLKKATSVDTEPPDTPADTKQVHVYL